MERQITSNDVFSMIHEIFLKNGINGKGIGMEVPNSCCITYDGEKYHVILVEEDSSTELGEYDFPEEALETYVFSTTWNYSMAERLKRQLQASISMVEYYWYCLSEAKN